MSEIDLIKKLERLNSEKPNKDWVAFTKESILSTSPELERQGFGLWFEKERLSNFAPLTICVMMGLIFGFFVVSVDNQPKQVLVENNEQEQGDLLVSAETEQNQEINNETEESVIADLPEDYTGSSQQEEPSIEELQASLISAALSEEESAEVIDTIKQRAERIKQEIIECNKNEMQGLLNEEDQQRCFELKEQLNQFEEFLNND